MLVILNRKLGARIPFKKYDIDYDALVYGSEEADCVSVKSTHPLYILYTSGKLQENQRELSETQEVTPPHLNFQCNTFTSVKEDEVFWAASDIGWAVRHSYTIYGPLFNRNTSIIFEGKPVKTPDASTFWRIISEHKVSVMFTAPTAIRAIKKEDPNGDFIKQYDLQQLASRSFWQVNVVMWQRWNGIKNTFRFQQSITGGKQNPAGL